MGCLATGLRAAELFGCWQLSCLAAVWLLAAELFGCCSWELPWSPRFYAALDPSYAKEWQPIIASVSEHQPPSW